MKIIGDEAEERALNFLIAKGYLLVAKNVRYPFGEIDLVMKDKHTLVFIEVRLRKNSKFGSPFESVNKHKQKKIIRAAQAFLQDTRAPWPHCRFDVVAVFPLNIEHLEDAFWAF